MDGGVKKCQLKVLNGLKLTMRAIYLKDITIKNVPKNVMDATTEVVAFGANIIERKKMMINAVVHLKIFDAVVNHAYRVQKPKTDTFTIPQEDFQKFENARQYALELNRRGLLEEFYKRIVSEAV